MDEGMEEFIEICGEEEPFELDPVYEYDAARFFDFTRPETDSQVLEADRWFQCAPDCPPSPLILKLNLKINIPSEEANGSGNLEECEKRNNSSVKKTPAKTKSIAKTYEPRSSTLMKPTASHLAKQNVGRDSYPRRILGRSERPFVKINERYLHIPPGFESEATKRQKLERGYLRKVAHLKHQTLLLHKIAAKIDGNSGPFKPRVTIPREPNLATAQRAQKQRSKNSSSSSEQAKSDAAKFKARPLNRKVLEAPLSRLAKKATPKQPDLQEFCSKTMQKAMQHSSANDLHNCELDIDSGATDIKRYKNEDAPNIDKFDSSNKVKDSICTKKVVTNRVDVETSRNTKKEEKVPRELKLRNDKMLLQNPPIELFKKRNKTSWPRTPLSAKSCVGSQTNVAVTGR